MNKEVAAAVTEDSRDACQILPCRHLVDRLHTMPALSVPAKRHGKYLGQQKTHRRLHACNR